MYLNTDQVEAALVTATSGAFNAFTTLVPLPNKTWENRQCNAVRIGQNTYPGRPTIFFVGGLHAREWGSCDILISFIERLQDAYIANTGITIGGATFAAADIQALVNDLDIIVFPQANPDGRNYSMTHDNPTQDSLDDAMWRKNRRTQSPNSGTGDCVGVDLNRNFDFLWNFPALYSTSAQISDSTSPCHHDLYHGPAAFSEPETQNVKWLFDTFTNIGYFMDLHSYSGLIMYSWGDDEDQTTDPDMTFMNPAYDGQRGVAGDSYKEYIPPTDLMDLLNLANAMKSGVQSVRGTNYVVQSDYDLYPTSGTSDDYAYSRHFTDPGNRKILSMALEWGNVSTGFVPIYSDMANIIDDVVAGLLNYCIAVRNNLKQCAIILERNPISQDEIDARRLPSSTVGLPVKNAMRVVVDGFTAAELGITGAGFTLAVASPVAGITITCTGNTSDTVGYGLEIQRFTFHYDINFPDDSAFSFTGLSMDFTLNAAIGGISASALLTLIKQADPFLLHGDPAWLSIDLRLFTVRAGEGKFGVPGVTDASDAPRFIQQVMKALTDGQGMAGAQSFDDPNVLSPDEDKSKLYLQPDDENGNPVFNFALAKVHYIGLSGATNVRVFFRLRQTQVTYAPFDYPPGGQYRRAASNPDGQPIALAGIENGEYVTVPCFSRPRIDSTVQGANQGMDQQTDSPIDSSGYGNIRTFVANTGGSEVDHYFGSWIDINQPENRLPVNVPSNQDGPFDLNDPNVNFRPVPLKAALARNLHLCLIAEINFDPTPIPPGKDPSNWDKLAQRNIAWSDTGSAQAVTTFEILPTPQALPASEAPDELMIDWGNTPKGRSASIYLPSVKTDTILAMANRMYTTHRLTKLDENTLECRTGGITYIPVPQGADISFTGLLSVDLPEHLRQGDVYTIVVRQVTNAFGKTTSSPAQITRRRDGAYTKDGGKEIGWRKILGAFQLTIPVRLKASLLFQEERDLSVLRWIGSVIPKTNRWYPVFQRYLEKIAGRVKTFGGDPGKILPSPTGDGVPKHHERRISFTGKIISLMFDRFGDFAGFTLDTADGNQFFNAREPEIEKVVNRAWTERILTTIIAERDAPHRPEEIILHNPPRPMTR